MTERPEPYRTKRDALPRLLGEYALYPAGTTPLEAHAAFEQEYGYPPTDTRMTGGGTLAGPIREEPLPFPG